MSETAAVQRFAYTLGANEAFNIAMPGTFVYLESATGDFAIEKNNTGGQLQIPSGTKVRFTEQFQSVRIIDKSGAANTIVVYIGAGDVEIAGATTIVGTVNVEPLSFDNAAGTSNITVTTAATSVASASANRRRRVTLRAATTNVNPVWLSATAGTGMPLYPGESIAIDSVGAITGIVAAGTEVVHRFTETT